MNERSVILISSFSILTRPDIGKLIAQSPVSTGLTDTIVRPGHQSEVNYDYVSKICRKFTRTQSETSITLMGHPQNSNSIVTSVKGFGHYQIC